MSAPRHEAAEVAVVVVPDLGHREAVMRQIGRELLVLHAADLQQQMAIGAQEHRCVLNDPPHDVESVGATVERVRRLVPLHVDGEEVSFTRGDVRARPR